MLCHMATDVGVGYGDGGEGGGGGGDLLLFLNQNRDDRFSQIAPPPQGLDESLYADWLLPQ